MELRAEAPTPAIVYFGPDRTHDQVSRLEETLTQRIREMETLLQVLPIGIGITSDPQCGQIRMNPAFAQMLALPNECAAMQSAPEIAATASFLCDGEEVPAEHLPMQVAASQGVEVHDVELEIVGGDGTIRHVLGSAAPLLDEQGVLRGSVGAFTDITERKQLETTLQNSERRFRALVENCSDAIAILSAQGHLEYASPSTQRMLGYALGEYIGKSPLGLVHPDDCDRVSQCFLQLAQHPGRRVMVEYRLRHKNGSWIWIDAVGTNLLEEPAVRGIVINYRNITAQKRLEEQIKALNVRLQRAMLETHHRIKNNLQVISALIDMQVSEGKSTIALTALKRIGQHIQALADIHDLLTQDARASGEAREISIKIVLEKLVERIQAAIQGRPIRHEIEDALLPVRQCSSLALVVSELISNAVKHGQGEIVLVMTYHGDQARLEVLDDGPGFPPGFNARKTDSTGLELVESVGRLDLRGKLSYANRHEGGAIVRLEFALPQGDLPGR